jgi:MoxR-like ATPase
MNVSSPPEGATTALAPEAFAERAQAIEREVGRVIVGQAALVRQTLTGLLANSHVLLEGVPGLGKTMLVRTIADVIDCTFNRVQFTPDLMPADITGTNILVEEAGQRVFRFQSGPIFANLVLADEINRATPKTQSSLLECMEERQATVDGTTWAMPDPFLVIATQNPIEYEGTFALPEAQLDRFMLRIKLGYPNIADEIHILDEQKRTHPIDELDEVCSVEELREMQADVRDIYVDPSVADYIVRLVNGTRSHPDVYLGASPRGSIALYRAGQALAGLLGRDYVNPDDIKAVAEFALAHRLIIKTSSSVHDVLPAQIVAELLETTPIGHVPDGIPSASGLREVVARVGVTES